MLLRSSHNIANLMFEYYHIAFLHAGPQLLLALVRQQFWIIGGRNLARKTVRNCIKRCRFSGKTAQPNMGDLPAQRLYTEFPLINTAVDYAGPVMILNRKRRSSKLIKSYLCIFICLAIKEVYIELVTDLTSDTFLAAHNRFIARRSKPAKIFSDNGPNFAGACNELAKFLKQGSDYIASKAADSSMAQNVPP
ncbi:unnamed protein product [Euphydryas editha]|uniref:Integrase zinc-binding domain-containing protein n=1 Tax=Euphydryas editha TaxID=104508 RepID=A0AAU9UTY0_EUPED|nr:unnamed protein product [Euphydryas editha]